jgi:transcriptional regulator GlxA family with amidase domain
MRKLKAATGLSATAYIRYLRLRKAAHLLLEQPEACILGIARRWGLMTIVVLRGDFGRFLGGARGVTRNGTGI